MKKIDSFSSAFTMIELVFVIVILGILTSIAVPKLAATRTDAVYAKARDTVMSIRTALIIEKQKRMLRGKHGQITDIGDSTNAIGNFYDKDGDTGVQVLSENIPDAKSDFKYKWHYWGSHWYGFCTNDKSCSGASDAIWFRVSGGKFLCIDKVGYQPCSLLGLNQ